MGVIELDAKIKRWGASYGIILPKDVVESQGFKENDEVRARIMEKMDPLSSVRGSIQLAEPIEDIISEIKEDWTDEDVP